jgi:hypothetical protein
LAGSEDLRGWKGIVRQKWLERVKMLL